MWRYRRSELVYVDEHVEGTPQVEMHDVEELAHRRCLGSIGWRRGVNGKERQAKFC